MAKGNKFKTRFPHFRIFIVIAVAIAIPITLWSFNNAPTNYQQFAQAPKCGPNNQNPTCPTDYKCTYIANNPLFGGNCALKTLKAVKNLLSDHSCKYNFNGPNDANFTFSWDKVQNANIYKVYGNYYYVNQGSLVNVKVGPYNTTFNSTTINIPVPHDVKYFYWYVRPYNSSYNVLGPMGSAPAILLNCN